MRKVHFITASVIHHDKSVVGLSFEKDSAVKTLDDASPLDYIQELPGHSSSKTTEIHKHVSLKGFAKFKNPFNDNFFDDR